MKLLGPVEFRRDDDTIELTTSKAIGLLGYLAVTDTPQSRDHLAGFFWSESHEDAARKNLRNTLWSIRKALGDEVIDAGSDRVSLNDVVKTDVQQFETVANRLENEDVSIAELQEVAQIYRGPLLDGLSVSDAPEFEIWLTTVRERFEQKYLRMLDALVAAHRDAGQWRQIIAVARQALRHDNLQEPMYRALMEAHTRLGERGEALRQYDVLRDTLARELGVKPLLESQALREQILNGEMQPATSEAQVTRTSHPQPPMRRPTAPASSRRIPFVGRRSEWLTLTQELQHAGQGEFRVVLLTGELGIGKTRLWQEWSQTIPEDATVLETRCLDTTQSLPFAPLTTLFSRQTCAQRLFTPPSPLAPVWLTELSRLLPEIKTSFSDLPAPPTLPPEEERRRLFEAFTQTIRAMNGVPLVLFIDDLHWVDRATLDWLVYLADRLGDERLLLAGAYRPTDTPAPLVRVVARWVRQGVARRLPLERLQSKDTSELLAALGVDMERSEELQAKSTGNPYFLIELSRAAPGDTPPQLVELIRARLDRLPDATRQVLQAAAVLDADFDFATLRRTSGRGEEETLDALDDLLDATVLREQGGSYEFAHPLVATVVRDNLSLARQSFLHRRAAEALETTHPGRLGPIAGQLTHHYRHAGRLGTAADYAEMAADHALALAAPEEAVYFYRTALELSPTPARRLGLGRALIVQGDLHGGRKTLRAAREEFDADGDDMGVAQASLELAESYLPSGRGDLTIHWARDALPHLGSDTDPAACSYAQHLLGAGSLLTDRSLADAEEHLHEAVRLATENNLPDAAARSRFELGNLFAQQGDLDKALAAFEETIALAQSIGDTYQETLGHNNLAYHALLAGDLETALNHIETALTLSEQHSLFLPRQYLYSTRGEIALAAGDLDAADKWFEQTLAEAERFENQVQVANTHANRALVARERGDLDTALLELEAAQQTVSADTSPHLRIKIDLWLAELHIRRGETTAAEEALAHAEAQVAGTERKGLQKWAKRIRTQLTT